MTREELQELLAADCAASIASYSAYEVVCETKKAVIHAEIAYTAARLAHIKTTENYILAIEINYGVHLK
jgi:hypothetical protein